jgi:hypothetical protein
MQSTTAYAAIVFLWKIAEAFFLLGVACWPIVHFLPESCRPGKKLLSRLVSLRHILQRAMPVFFSLSVVTVCVSLLALLLAKILF